MDQLRKYTPKTERYKLNAPLDWRSAPENDENTLYGYISAELARLRVESVMPITDAVIMYTDIRAKRHDVWCEFINNTKINRYLNVSDTRVGYFCEEVLRDVKDNLILPDDSISRLTPDILFYDTNLSIIYLGDVAVSVSPKMTLSTKFSKYRPVKNYLEEQGFVVSDAYLVLDQKMGNVVECISRLADIGLIKSDTDEMNRGIEMTNKCNTIMKIITDRVTNYAAFVQALDANDSRSNTIENVISLLPELKREVEAYHPSMSEDDLINMIKEEVNGIDPDEYFTNDISKSMKAIDDIYDKNKTKIHITPKSTLKIVDNSGDIELNNNHNLIEDYLVDILDSHGDEMIKGYLLHLLPVKDQLMLMKKIYDKNLTAKEVKGNIIYKKNHVYGPYQYEPVSKYSDNLIITNYQYQLTKGKTNKNIKEVPKQINLANTQFYYDDIEQSMNYYGTVSMKPSPLTNEWDVKTNIELINSKEMRGVYDYVRSTNGVQLCASLCSVHDRICHLSTNQSMRTNIVVPPNGNFIAIIPKNHAPVNSRKSDLPMIYITRVKKDKDHRLTHFEEEYMYETNNYCYYISKLSRIDINKMSSWSSSHHKLCASASYLLHKNPKLSLVKEKVVGLLTYFILDTHQKTSEFLDLFKYVSFMPFSDISRLPELIKDKFCILMKTKLDAWMLKSLRSFVLALSDKECLKATKPKLRLNNTEVSPESLGISMNLPSFINTNIRHAKPDDFIEEISVLYTVRPKHLYGSQFIDKSTTDTAKWNNEYKSEIEEHGSWLDLGVPNPKSIKFPFDAKFAFSADAIYYAEIEAHNQMAIRESDTCQNLANSKYTDYMHMNCTLRGCTKNKKERGNASDIHTTSLESALSYYESVNYDEEECKVMRVAQRSILSGERHEYSMSEKDQRGGGRPIATPTLGAKAELMIIEKPEAAKGKFASNNIIVPNKNKANEMCKRYKDAIETGAREGKKYIFQLTEDQSKFSENDNINKYYTYIRTNRCVGNDIKSLQMSALDRLSDRVHLVKRIPISIENDDSLKQYVVNDSTSLGIKSIIGWPQGMLNFISTSVHSAADVWITYAYNKAYPENKVTTRGLVHSDDSWVAVACNSIADFKKFTLFRIKAKKLFCLKVNEKKLWGSSTLGEMVSNFNLNGNVHLTVGKNIVNSFNNLNYQNWVIDVHSQISSIQQCYRGGANLPEIILLSTLLRQQVISQYKIKGTRKEYLYQLPIDLGGYPSNSVFELAVNGLSSHYYTVLQMIKTDPLSLPSKITMQVLEWSLIDKKKNIKDNIDNPLYSEVIKLLPTLEKLEVNADNIDRNTLEELFIRDDDYDRIVLPSKANIFSCINHIMPRPRKVVRTIEKIKKLEFLDDGLGELIRRPGKISISLGHLKGRANSRSYELAADKYTQSAQRLAVNQSIQSSQKVIKINEFPAMTFNELYLVATDTYDNNTSKIRDTIILDEAFNDCCDMVVTANNIVHSSTLYPINLDKRKVLSKMPNVDSKFTTYAPLVDVLLRLIDSSNNHNTNYYYTYSSKRMPIEIVDDDVKNIKLRFNTVFNYCSTIDAASLILRESSELSKSKLWTQPNLRNDNIITFLEDLYGKSLNKDTNYNVKIHDVTYKHRSHDADLVHTLYNLCILNSLYPGKFIVDKIGSNRIDPITALNQVDQHLLSENDRLKYGVTKLKMAEDTHDLSVAMRELNYKQEWVVSQRRGPSGYTGDFKAVCKSGQVVVVVEKRDEEISLSVNKVDIPKILFIMHKFVNTNFRWLSYTNKGAWGMSNFWRTTCYPTHNKYLTWYGVGCTTITNYHTNNSIGITIDSNIRYTGPEMRYVIEGIDTDNSLRLIYVKVKGADGITRNERTCNIQQNLNIPLRNQVILEPDFVEGFSNQKLLEYGIMESSLLNNPHGIKHEDAITLLKSGNALSNKPLVSFMLHLFCKEANVSYEIGQDDEALTIIDVDIGCVEKMNTTGLISTAEQTKPEDLEAIYEDFVTFSQPMGKVIFVNNLKMLICKSLIPEMSDRKIMTFLRELVRDRNMVRWKNRIKNKKLDYIDYDDSKSGIESWVEDVVENLEYGTYEQEVDPRLMAFIIVNKLDTKEVIDSLPTELLRDRSWVPENTPIINEMAGKFIKSIHTLMFENIEIIEEDDIYS